MGNIVVDAATKTLDIVKDPAVRAKALELARKGASFVLPTDDASLKTAVRDPAKAGVVLGGFARAGVPPELMFDDIIRAQSDAAAAKILASCRQQFADAVGRQDKNSAVHNKLSSEQEAEQLRIQSVLVWGKEQFGSAKSLRAAFYQLRALLELDSETFEHNMKLNSRLLGY